MGRDLLIRARWPLLGLAAFLCGAIVILLAAYRGAVAATAFEAAAIAMLTALAALWLTRSFRVAIVAGATVAVTALFSLAVLTPVAAAIPILCDLLIPHAIASMLIVTGAATLVVGEDFMRELCAGTASDAAAWSAVARFRSPIVLGLIVTALWRALLLFPLGSTVVASDYSVLSAITTGLFAPLVVLVLMPLALGAVKVHEHAIANANRRREWRERMAAPFEMAVMTRWAMSFLGIAVVVVSIALVGGRGPTTGWIVNGAAWPTTIALAGLIAAVGLRDWRAFVTCALPAAAVGTLVAAWSPGLQVWLIAEDPGFLSWPQGSGVLCMATVLASAGCLMVSARVARHRRLDDPLDVAFSVTLKEVTAPILCFSLVLAAGLIPTGLWPAPLLAAAAALIVTPALTAVVERLFPRRRSLEDAYGRRS